MLKCVIDCIRYQLVVYHYSNAHRMHTDGRPMMRPLLMDFPGDVNAAPLTTEWMDGDALLAAPIVTSTDGKTTDNTRGVYLPSGASFYAFNTSTVTKGGQWVNVTATLAEGSHLFAVAGSIVPLAPVTQWTDQLPGGPLDVHVYAGKDATFAMVEDDGESTDYADGTIRTTTFTWTEATKTLSWAVTGPFAGDTHSFTSLMLTAHTPAGTTVSAVKTIGTSGSITASTSMSM